MTNFILTSSANDQGVGFDIGCSYEEMVLGSNLLGDKATWKPPFKFLSMPSMAGRIIDYASWSITRYIDQAQDSKTLRPLNVFSPHQMPWPGPSNMRLSFIGCRPSTFISDNGTKKSTKSLVCNCFRTDQLRFTILQVTLCSITTTKPSKLLKTSLPSWGVQIATHLTNADIGGWVCTEQKFLEELKEEPQECVLASAYVDALIQWCKA